MLSNMVLRDCHVGLRPPRNDKPSAFAVLLTACLLHQCSAGSGMPLPYNGVCDQRECLPEIATAPWGPRNDKLGGIAPNNLCRNYCQPVRRSLSAATDAIGAYHFNGTLYRLLVQRRERHAAPLQRTIDGHFRSRDPYFFPYFSTNHARRQHRSAGRSHAFLSILYALPAAVRR